MIRILSTAALLALLTVPALAAPGTKECRNEKGYNDTQFSVDPDGSGTYYPLKQRVIANGKQVRSCYDTTPDEATVQSGGSPAEDPLADQNDNLGIDIDLAPRDLD
jgi:hypothetical protein